MVVVSALQACSMSARSCWTDLKPDRSRRRFVQFERIDCSVSAWFGHPQIVACQPNERSCRPCMVRSLARSCRVGLGLIVGVVLADRAGPGFAVLGFRAGTVRRWAEGALWMYESCVLTGSTTRPRGKDRRADGAVPVGVDCSGRAEDAPPQACLFESRECPTGGESFWSSHR